MLLTCFVEEPKSTRLVEDIGVHKTMYPRSGLSVSGDGSDDVGTAQKS